MIFTPAKIFILNFRVYTIFYYLPQLRILSFKSIYICLFLPHCAGPEFMLCWLKLYSSDNHCTTVSPIKNPPLKVSVYLLKVQNTLFTDPSNIFNLNVSKKRMERACNKMQKAFINLTMPLLFFLYLGFLSRPFTNHRTARERGRNFSKSSLPFPLASQTLSYASFLSVFGQ